MHNEAHGISGTHMQGSERFTCKTCQTDVTPENNDGRFLFILDVTSPSLKLGAK